MSIDPKGILAYGYDLGGQDEGWEIENVDSGFTIDEEVLQEILLDKLIGFNEKYPLHSSRVKDRQEYNERRKAAEEKLGIELVRYGSYDYPSWILATKVFRAPDYGSMIIPRIKNSRFFVESHVKLNTALDALDFKPNQAEPSWILASFYG